jgi:hypothetical protein
LRGPVCLRCITYYCVPTAYITSRACSNITLLTAASTALGLTVLLLLTAHSLFTPGTRGRSYCCSRHTVYTYLGLAVLLLLLTAHSLFILGTHGPAVAHGTQPIHTLLTKDSRSTAYGISKPMLAYLFLQVGVLGQPFRTRIFAHFSLSIFCTLCLGLCALCLKNL